MRGTLCDCSPAVRTSPVASVVPEECHATSVTPARYRHILVLLVVWTMSMAYAGLLLNRGWVPHDEGTLAHSALRVLQGEMPHRDFDDAYTGGLSYLNALALEMFGPHLMSMRYMAYLAFACWIPILYYLSSIWVSPLMAGLVTLSAVAWSYHNYTAAMPSWYVLYFLTAAIAALSRFLSSGRTWWLIGAGVLTGLACLFKVVGLYFAAASLLLFVYLEQTHSSARYAGLPGGLGGRTWFSWLTASGLAAFAVAVFLLIRQRLGAEEFVQFLLPSLTAVGLLLSNEWAVPRGQARERLDRLLRLTVPYFSGLVVVAGLFAIFYLLNGGLEALASGIFVKPFRRLDFAARRPPPITSLLLPIVFGGLLVLHGWLPRIRREIVATAVVLSVGALLAPFLHSPLWLIGWLSLSQAVPLVVLAAVPLLLKRKPGQVVSNACQAQLALLTLATATVTLVQYPWSTPTYFCYVAPLVLLAATSTTVTYHRGAGTTLCVLLAFYTVHAGLWLTPWELRLHDSRGLLRDAETRILLPDLAGLRVAEPSWLEYQELVSLIEAKAVGDYIYATPDSPEIYVLSGLQNPTGTQFEFLDASARSAVSVLSTLERYDVNMVVVNQRPLFSPPIRSDLARAFENEFPHDSIVGRYVVRWR